MGLTKKVENKKEKVKKKKNKKIKNEIKERSKGLKRVTIPLIILLLFSLISSILLVQYPAFAIIKDIGTNLTINPEKINITVSLSKPSLYQKNISIESINNYENSSNSTNTSNSTNCSSIVPFIVLHGYESPVEKDYNSTNLNHTILLNKTDLIEEGFTEVKDIISNSSEYLTIYNKNNGGINNSGENYTMLNVKINTTKPWIINQTERYIDLIVINATEEIKENFSFMEGYKEYNNQTNSSYIKYSCHFSVNGEDIEKRCIPILIETKDEDQDNYTSIYDCNEKNQNINPGVDEVLFNDNNDDCKSYTLDNPQINISLLNKNITLFETVDINITYPCYNSTINISIGHPDLNNPGFYLFDYHYEINGSHNPLEYCSYIIEYNKTNYEGEYHIEVNGIYLGEIISSTKAFNASNDLAIEVEGEMHPSQYETEVYRSKVYKETNGKELTSIDPSNQYICKWYLWNNSIIEVLNDGELNLSFGPGDEGNHKINISCEDSYKNKVNKEIDIYVKPVYKVKISVKDKNSGKKINATIGIKEKGEDDYEEWDYSSEKEFLEVNLTEGNYTIKATNPLYLDFIEEVEIKEDKTVNIEMDPIDVDPPLIEIVSPQEGERVGGSVSIVFNTIDANRMVCSLYLSNKNSTWMSKREEVSIDSGKYKFDEDLQEGVYKGKIECIDIYGNTAEKEFSFIVVNDELRKINVNELYNLVEDSISKINTLDDYSREMSDLINVKEKLKKADKVLEFINRDINDIFIEPSYTEKEREEKREEVLERLDDLLKSTIIEVKAYEKYNFIDYPTKEELKELAKKYKERVTNSPDTEVILNRLLNGKERVIVTTKIYVGKVKYMDNHTEEISVVHREVKINKESEGELLFGEIYELIPKETGRIDQIEMITKGNIINPDPLISFDIPSKSNENIKEINYTYIIKKKITEEEAKKLVTGFMTKEKIVSGGKVTGMSFLNFEIDWKNSLLYSIIGSILVSLILYIILSIMGIVPSFISKEGKSVKKIKKLVIEGLDELDNKNYEKAVMIYNEAKMLYEKGKESTRKKTYQMIINLLKKINRYYIEQLISEVKESKEKEGTESVRYRKAKEELLKAYNELTEEEKDDYKEDLKGI